MSEIFKNFKNQNLGWDLTNFFSKLIYKNIFIFFEFSN